MNDRQEINIDSVLARLGKKIAQAEFEAEMAQQHAASIQGRVHELEQALGDAMARVAELEGKQSAPPSKEAS